MPAESLENWSLRFVRWGMGLTMLGLLMGFAPLGHYLLKDALPSCPSAPIHGHAILLSFVGMPMFGLIYRVLPAWMAGPPPVSLIRTHFRLSVAGIVGIVINGAVVYEVIGHVIQPGFYYAGPSGQFARNIWFGLDGAFLTMYGIGCVIFLYILMKRTAYAVDGAQRAPVGAMRDRAVAAGARAE